MAQGEIIVSQQIPMKMRTDVDSFRSILEQKEKEIIGFCEEQIFGLQQQIFKKDKELGDLATTYLQLQDDFKYNLALLDERDAELMQYDASTPLLQASALEAEERLKEVTDAISNAQSQLSKEKGKLIELERHYERELSTLNKQMDTLRREKDEHMKQLKLLEADNAELKHQIGKERHELFTKNQKLEKEYLDRIHKQKLESKAAVDEVVAKLHLIESEVKQLRQVLDEGTQKQKLQQKLELDLRASIVEKDHEIQKMSSEFRQLERELNNTKLEADLEERHLSDKIEKIKDDYECQISQLKGQVERLMRKLETRETRLKDCERDKFEQLALCNEKLHSLEQELVEKEELKKKLEQAELDVQKTKTLHEQRLQESKIHCEKWRTEYDNVQSQCKMLQKELVAACERENFLQATRLNGQEKAKLPKLTAHYQKEALTPVEPWLDDVSIPEDIVHERAKDQNLEFENHRLRATVQALKDENTKLGAVVETMRVEMQILQNHTMEETLQLRNAPRTPERKSDESKELQAELQSLKTLITKMTSNSQNAQHGKPETCEAAGESVTRDSDPQQNMIHELERSQAILRAQLEGAIADIGRVSNERDLLMELSNSLRADLNRMLNSAAPYLGHSIQEIDCLGKNPQLSNQAPTGMKDHNDHLQVEGNAAPQYVRQPPESVTHKGTESQQARMKSMKRRDDPKSVKAKVRNYNLKDDTDL